MSSCWQVGLLACRQADKLASLKAFRGEILPQQS
jgi:hypothetical protein